MVLNKETQNLIIESVNMNIRDIANKIHEELDEGSIPVDLMKKITKLEELRQSIASKNSD